MHEGDADTDAPHAGCIYILIVPDFDAAKQQWEGPTLTTAQALSQYGADHAYTWTEAKTAVPTLCGGMQRLFCLPEQQHAMDQQQSVSPLFGLVSAVKTVPTLAQQLAPLRLHKSPMETQAMQFAGLITAQMHQAAMQSPWVGRTEQEIERALRSACLLAGGSELAYPSIVAAGENACVLHHTPSERRVQSGELLLIDAGAEYACYAADVTRTFPVDPVFTPPQKAIYNAVLTVQNAIIAQVQPGVSWQDLTACFLHVLVEQLVALGLLQGAVSDLLSSKAWFAFCPHSFGHWLGLDVHDVGAYQTEAVSQVLAPGMVFTVEPGIYVPVTQAAVPDAYRGIGVRIEDNVCVTASGHTVLSADIPKSVEAIERLRQWAGVRTRGGQGEVVPHA